MDFASLAPHSRCGPRGAESINPNNSVPLPAWPATNGANRSSTSSFYSPDLDVEFMDLDFDPDMALSDSQQDLVPSDSNSHLSSEGDRLGASANNLHFALSKQHRSSLMVECQISSLLSAKAIVKGFLSD